jgi:Xaa-Pro dipeptidase
MVTRRRFLMTAAATAPTLALHAQHRSHDKPPAPVTPAPECSPALPAPILALTDRSKDAVPITVDERESRLDVARELMKQYKIDAILITTGASLRYFAGINWGQSERLFAYVIPQAAAPFIICPKLEAQRLADSTMTQLRGETGFSSILPEREETDIFPWNENEDPFFILKRGLALRDILTGTLGIEEHTQYAFVSAIGVACPAIELTSATPVTAGCRSLKSPAEIALMRLANQITFDVYKAVYLSCAPGDTNHRFSELVSRAYERSGVHGEASCNVGVNSAIPHGSGRPQVIREGEMVLIDDGCTVDGYTSDISRSFVYGNPSDFQRGIFEIVYNAQSAALAAAGPGVPMEIVDAAARQVIVKANYGPAYDYFTHRVGHGIGLDMHEWPYLVQGNTQKMVAGMTFSDEPGIYIPGKFGIRLEDDMLINDHGAELFTSQSPSLQDPFAIPAVLPDKSKDAPTADPAVVSKPAETKPSDASGEAPKS